MAINSRAFALICGFEIVFESVLKIVKQNSIKFIIASYDKALFPLGFSFRISVKLSIKS